jgi:nucleoside-diphosphate-sugar epimerase
MFPEGVEELRGDITRLSDTQSAVQGVDSVIHLAALLHIVNPPPELEDRYRRINVGGTEMVVNESIKAAVRHVVFFSTISVYGQTEGKVLNEESPISPGTYYAQTKLMAEKIVLAARCRDGRPLGTVLRLATVYGACIKGNFQQFVRALVRGYFIPIGNGKNRRTLVYAGDVARAAALAMQNPLAAGKIYNVTDGKFHTINEISSAICQAAGLTPPRFSIPIYPVRFCTGILEFFSQLIGKHSPINRAMIDKFTEDVAVEGERIQVELGFRPEYGLHAAWQDALREMREHGEL